MNQQNNSAVIGAGIIGICCGISLVEKGYKVTIYDPEPPGSMTTKGLAGGFGFTDVMPMAAPGMLKRIPGWLLDPCGPLFVKPTYFPKLIPWLMGFYKAATMDGVKNTAYALADMLRASMGDTRELINKTKLNHLFLEDGALTIYKSKESALKDRLEWDVKKSMGVNVQMLKTPEEINELEPGLENANFGFYTPEWCNTSDPFKLATGIADYFKNIGGEIVNSKVTSFDKNENAVSKIALEDGHTKDFDHVVIAAGIWSKEICSQLGEKVLMESERGYNTTLPNPGVSINRELIFGEEKFVITKISNGLRIGGAAEFAGIHSPPNYRRSEKLVEIARRYLPNLDDTGGEKWMGHRPTTPDSMPVISRSSRYNNVYYAFGHSHAGLTMAATTGKLIAQIVSNEQSFFDIDPFSIKRFY